MLRALRGTGAPGSRRWDPELIVDDLVRLVRALGHDVVDLLGFSTGGQVAQLFVEVHPSTVRRLALASTTAYAEVDKYLDGWQ